MDFTVQNQPISLYAHSCKGAPWNPLCVLGLLSGAAKSCTCTSVTPIITCSKPDACCASLSEEVLRDRGEHRQALSGEELGCWTSSGKMAECQRSRSLPAFAIGWIFDSAMFSPWFGCLFCGGLFLFLLGDRERGVNCRFLKINLALAVPDIWRACSTG